MKDRGYAVKNYVVFVCIIRVNNTPTCTYAQDKRIDLGKITGGGSKKIEKTINESGYMRISSSSTAEWTENNDYNDIR